MTVFVLPIKYAHIKDIVTQIACRVMAHVPVSSLFYPKSCGGSQMEYMYTECNTCTQNAIWSCVCGLSIISIITLMTIENRALWLARSFALSRYNPRAVIITLKASSFQNGSQICWCFGVGNWSKKFFLSNNHQCNYFVSVTIRRYSRRLRRLIVNTSSDHAHFDLL